MSREFSEHFNQKAISTDTAGGSDVYPKFGKRLFDVLVVILTAPFTLFVLLLIAIAISLEGGSVLYFQDRVGRGGKIFRFLKMRTMVKDADERLDQYLTASPEARIEWELHQKLRDDPRVTRVGRFLRASSLDELPQIWNILIGDMSLVGPRPMTPNQIDLYPGSAYYALRPGLTGPWQVGDRNESSFAGRAAYDNAYSQSVTLFQDLALIYRTLGVVLRGTGV